MNEADERDSVWRDPGKRCDTCRWYEPNVRWCTRRPKREPTTAGRKCRYWAQDSDVTVVYRQQKAI